MRWKSPVRFGGGENSEINLLSENYLFLFTCGSCGKQTSVTVDNQTLVEAKDKDVFKVIEEVTSSELTGEELVANSIVHKRQRIMLNDSKIIIDVKTPTLWDNLSLIKASNPQIIKEYSETFSSMLFIANLYMLDVRKTHETGTPCYYEVKEKTKILDILLRLTNNDGEQLEDEIENKLAKYNITYEIHGCKCSHCKEEIPNIPIDMESILFTRINKERKRKTTN